MGRHRRRGRRRCRTHRCSELEPVTRRDSKERRRAAAEKTLAALPKPDIRAYTDGSVLYPDRLRDGGGGYYLVDASGKEHRGRCAAGKICDSFRSELHALRL